MPLYFRIFEGMERKVVFVLLGLLVFICAGNAQLLKPLPIFYSNENRNNQQGTFLHPVIVQRVFEYSDNMNFSKATNLKCALPKGAIFCRMEDAIYNHLNFWVKFRMGTEDKYSN